MRAEPGSGIPRRRFLLGLGLMPALAGCAMTGTARPADPLIALADAARTDAALGTAAINADRSLAEAVRPLVDARTAHAAALDAEVQRLRGAGSTATPAASPAAAPPVPGPVPLTRLRTAIAASADAAAAVAIDLPVDRVGLVASVAACCATYASVLA